ncbi:acyl carrier protein [Stappia taiwanensis]|uniref:Acyl carrier protein n=1 Tax=Stappia taiwanensis TaxID=992267 RepID=A0A838XW25_9HYPH|nr:acyl carrier protein [Stappia taiwanensis]MBA4612696.1 acyl carrier protein [Stappia taiwanensis]GGE88390.1 hypothetical protein GCM10007285_14850 [Stappia taiwanensis]
MTAITRDQIVDFICKDLLIERLDLGASGIELKDLNEATALSEPPLSLDSVDTLELVVGVERQFSLPRQDLTPEELRETCATIGTLADYVTRRVPQDAAPAQ